MLKFLLIFVLFSIINGQMNKPGVCPPLSDIGICEISCFSDFHCDGNLKCCGTACGGTFCSLPATPSSLQTQVKPGKCPGKSGIPWICSSTCTLDGDCRGRKKCCQTRCGAMTCAFPEKEFP